MSQRGHKKVLAAGLVALAVTAFAHADDPQNRAAPPDAPAAPPAPPPGMMVLEDAAATLSDREILAAIDKGVDAQLALLAGDIDTLKKIAAAHPKPPEWAALASQEKVGEIALGVYALLTVGRLTGDPRLRFSSKEMTDAVQFLLVVRPQYTYALALQASALSMLPNRPEFRKALTATRDELLRGSMHAHYTYSTRNTTEIHGDNSNTQYGQLGIWACQDAGLEIPNNFWQQADQHWRSTQGAMGGWGYSIHATQNGLNGGTATMTAAGVASLFLAKDYLDHSLSRIPKPDNGLDAGIRWLSDHYKDYRQDIPSNLYLAYGVERVALAGGIRTLGDHDWYREGAALILGTQNADGSWTYGFHNVGTAYALLFLARGIAPVAVGKLQYGGFWNARSRDCARFTHWLYKTTERPVNWQIVNLTSNPDDWKNVPLLVITGHDDPGFNPMQIAKLRRYVLNGGTIFSSADEGDETFTKTIKQKYAPAIFNNDYEMRELPEDHPAFQLDYKTPKTKQPHLWGLSNGVRDVWIHSADDICATWQVYNNAKTQHFEVPANIYIHATGRVNPPPQLEPITTPAQPAPIATFNIARIIYAGNWNPEPGSWERFAREARQYRAVDIKMWPLRIAELDPAKTPLAHITGTTALSLSDDEKKKLRDYLDKGGTLLADAAGGSEVFAKSFKDLIAEVLPNDKFLEIPPDSPVLTGQQPAGALLKSPEKRRFDDFPENRLRPMWFMEIRRPRPGAAEASPAVLLSQADLTAGLAGLRNWGILGYTPDTTAALTWNSLLYLLRKPAVAPAAEASTAPAIPPAAPAPEPVDPAKTLTPIEH